MNLPPPPAAAPNSSDAVAQSSVAPPSSSGATPPPGAGHAMHAFARELFPICRSITGLGLRETLRRIGQRVPLTVHEVPSGTRVHDWEVPLEWTIRAGWLKAPDGRVLADFSRSNLQVVNYSAPVHAKIPLADLRPHLHSLPERPTWVPYRTSYYKRDWGFCLPHAIVATLGPGEYEAFIDSSLEPGSLSYGECVIPGESPDEVLVSCHACHPSLANDNLSGLVVATWLAMALAARPHRLTYRFVFVPGTIGSIAWLARNPETVKRIRHGLLLTCCGDPGAFTYKRSRRGDAVVDRAAAHVLRPRAPHARLIDFFPYGYDERQYCSPGYNLPVGCLMRTPHGEYPEYHTSADNLDLITPGALEESLQTALAVLAIVDGNRRLRSLNPFGEPQLGRRGLYRATGGDKAIAELQMAYLWVLNLADGEHDLLDVADRAAIAFPTIARAAEDLQRVGLVEELRPS